MQTYSIKGKTEVMTGFNLEIALIKAGYKNVRIQSVYAGEYIVRCKDHAILIIHWVEKRVRLGLPVFTNPQN